MRLVQPLPNLHSIQTTLRVLVLVLSEPRRAGCTRSWNRWTPQKRDRGGDIEDAKRQI